MKLSPVVGMVSIFNFSGMAGSNSVLEISVLSETNSFPFVVNRSQPTLIFCNPVDAAYSGRVVSLATCVPSVFSLCDRSQVFDAIVISDAVYMVDEIRIDTVYEFPNYSMGYPDSAVSSDTDVSFGVEAPCWLVTEHFVPRDIVRTRFPEQLSQRRIVVEDFYKFGLRRKLVGGHYESPCDMGTSVLDQTGIVKERVWH